MVSIYKAVRDLTDQLSAQAMSEARGEDKTREKTAGLPKSDLNRVINELEKQMKEAAKNLEFEKAAALRDQIFELRAMLAEETNAPPWEKIRYLAADER